ncbi:hypothetical protein HTV80_08665 [Streptomyces sp. Vc74B-19]|uniref:hypothetical protein n=1 Tax=unclassified Streptomyces TaxID=2593676 RepID=UPI001BFC7ED6|nr:MULTISPECIES: hypothetical protein [unclassified Streptomyces]MBT3163174.1 hypothetical protein [Streptomyces sp. Vc74B-19]MCO4699504.1 hypothetical protein [Streptomyces sp. RO-S4]MDU0299949.1 hypothetical protein [Streptomyces sp. PAL114]
MLRHEFQPGRLIAGTALIAAAVVYGGDAGGAWDTPWFVVIPVVVGGLCLAGAVGLMTGQVRRHRARRIPEKPTPTSDG